MAGKPRLGIHDALYLKPLLQGLDSTFTLFSDLPAAVAVQFRERPEEFRGAFLSPLDYARHGGHYRIVPGIAVSSALPTNTIQLFVRRDRRSVATVAVDVRVSSEIILAKIILTERFPNVPSDPRTLQFVPMMPDVSAMLGKADAALVINDVRPVFELRTDLFSLDLVEEWTQMTELPYVHGFWVTREDRFTPGEQKELVHARDAGIAQTDALSSLTSARLNQPVENLRKYLDSFSYHLGPREETGLSEFFRYCFYHGIIGDIPEINFLSFDEFPPSGPQNN